MCERSETDDDRTLQYRRHVLRRLQQRGGAGDQEAAGRAVQRRESDHGENDHYLRRGAGDAGADHGEGEEGWFFRHPGPEGEGPDGGRGGTVSKAGGEFKGGKAPADHGHRVRGSASLHLHGTHGAVSHAGSGGHRHAPESGEFCADPADSHTAGALRGAEILYRGSAGAVQGQSQHGFSGGHRNGQRIFLQSYHDHRRAGASGECPSAIL